MHLTARCWLVLLFVVLIGSPAWAQTGSWIEQSITVFGSGSRLYRSGGNCVAYTHENAAKILFFDINSSAWSELNFSSTQHFYDILAVGNLIFAYSDSFIIAYSGVTSHVDTVRYQGTPLRLDASPENNRSYQCGENLAIFLTDMKMYLFDVSVDHWLEFEYDLPTDYSGVGYYWVKEDYAGVLLYRNQQQVPTNLAYSVYSRAFARTARGMGWGDQNTMDQGFAGIYNWLPEVDQFAVGYSALTNQFTHITIPSDYMAESGVIYSNRIVDDFTVWEATARKTIEPYVSVYFKVSCYDTRRALWDTTTYNMNPQHGGGFNGWKMGGRFAWSTVNGDADLRTLYFYSGYTGEIFTTTPGLEMEYLSLLMLEGNNVCLVNDTSKYWAYSVETGQGAMMPYSRTDFRHHTGGEDYLTLNRYDITDVSSTYYYHGPSNTWSSIDLTNAYNSGYAAGTHVFATMTTGDNASVYFYSPTCNQVTTVAFAPGSTISVIPGDFMAVATVTGRTVILDTHYNNLHEFNCATTSNGVGENVVIAANGSAFSLSGYSSLTNNVTVLNLTETPYLRGAADFIGLAYIGYNGARYYAYNSFYDNWVELIPQGSYVGANVGSRTAIVVRSNYIYAFDPQAPSAIGDDNPPTPLPGQYIAITNYPNPFNSGTIICFTLPQASAASVAIYDLLGRLVDEFKFDNLSAGSHNIEWQPQRNAAGVYFCRLSAGDKSQTAKMILLK